MLEFCQQGGIIIPITGDNADRKNTDKAICTVKRKKGSKLGDGELGEFCDQLPRIIADALSCARDSEGFLGPEGVVVCYEKITNFDRLGAHDLVVIVQSTDIRERQKNISQRVRRVAREIKEIMPTGVKGLLLIQLVTSVSAEF